MQIDLDYLRRHYASLSDDALAAVNRNDLVAAAAKCLDEERVRREPAARRHTLIAAEPKVAESPDEVDSDDGVVPEWIEEASCVCAFADSPGTHVSPDAEHAQDVLQAAGIPCYVAVEEMAPETPSAKGRVEYRVLVPAALNLKAMSVLDREIFNAALEADWKAHFEMASDEELTELRPEIICAGLADRIERLTRAYENEIARRGL